MNELTQLQRAQKVADSFVPSEPSEGCYAYVFLGQASWDATSYEEIDGLYLMSRRVWHVEESRVDCVCYAGRGRNGRIDEQRDHTVLPSPHLRIKLRSDLSFNDSIELEKLLIKELGCICDVTRNDGCLVNILLHERGPFCCQRLEAAAYKNTQNQQKGAAARAVDVIAMAADKTIISRGSASGLARELNCCNRSIIKCCQRKLSGIWQKPEQRALYFCYAEDYENYNIKPMTNKQLNRNRILIAAKIDGSDICCGTSVEIGTYAPEIKNTGKLHEVAQGKRPTVFGWTARYADEEANESSAAVANCGPNLSAFF